MTEHTPGPWRIWDGKYCLQIHSERFWIANIKCEACPRDEMANARLIAAAPSLHAALVAIRDYPVGGSLDPDAVADRIKTIQEIAAEAVAKVADQDLANGQA